MKTETAGSGQNPKQTLTKRQTILNQDRPEHLFDESEEVNNALQHLHSGSIRPMKSVRRKSIKPSNINNKLITKTATR